MDLVGFKCPLRGEKKVVLEQENLDSLLKSIPTWNPACILNLKMWILKTRAANFFEILKSCISKWENGRRMYWPSPKKYNLPHRTTPSPPWNQKYFDLPLKPKIPKSQLALTLAGGAHYEVVMEFTDSLLKFLVFELDRTSCLLVCVVVRNKVFQT